MEDVKELDYDFVLAVETRPALCMQRALALHATLVRQLRAAMAASPVEGDAQERYWRVLEHGYLEAQRAPYAAGVSDDERIVGQMAARIWLAHLYEPPDGRWQLPQEEQLRHMCAQLAAQTRDAVSPTPATPSALELNLRCILRTHGNIVFNTSGASSLLALFNGTNEVRNINCVDLTFYANALYQWMGHAVYCVTDVGHAWLQDRVPPSDAPIPTDAARETLAATRFYDIASSNSWMRYAEWSSNAGHTYNGYCADVYGDFALNMLFLARACDGRGRHALLGIVQRVLNHVLRDPPQTMPARDLLFAQVEVGTQIDSVDMASSTATRLGAEYSFRRIYRHLTAKGGAHFSSADFAVLLHHMVDFYDVNGGGWALNKIMKLLCIDLERYASTMRSVLLAALRADADAVSVTADKKRRAHRADSGPVSLTHVLLLTVRVYARSILAYSAVKTSVVDVFMATAAMLRALFAEAYGDADTSAFQYVDGVDDVVRNAISAHFTDMFHAVKSSALSPGTVLALVQWPAFPRAFDADATRPLKRHHRTDARDGAAFCASTTDESLYDD